MNIVRVRACAVALAVGGVMPLSSVATEITRRDGTVVIGEARPDAIYMQSGVVDTSEERRGLADFIVKERGTLGGRRFVVQLDGAMRPAWRARMAAAGIEVGDYLPMHAFIVRLDGADAERVRKLEFVRWFDEYQRGWKTTGSVGDRALKSAERVALQRAGSAVVVITLFAGEGGEEVVRRLARVDGAQVHWVETIGGNVCLGATISKGEVANLVGLASVQFVEDAPELVERNDTDRWIVQSNVPNATPLYDRGIRGEGQIVGMMDSRLDRNHCSFRDEAPIGPLHRKIVAYNSGAGAEFHGTHVTGTVVGDANNNQATRGVAYMGKVAFNTIPAFNETEMQNRLTTHHTQGARVHTNSWGDDGTTQYNSLCRGIDAFSYNNEDDLVLFAVTNQSSLKNPENAKNLLAVGASQDAPSQHQHCSGGGGPTNDQRRKPEIYAPGCATMSANAGTSCQLAQATGTSMACPAVAGTAMLVRQYFMDGFYPSGARQSPDALTPSGALIKATLLNSAVDMTGMAGYPGNTEGWGRVLADDALFFEGDGRRLFVADTRNADGLSTGEEAVHAVNVLSGETQLKVTLAWTEPAATAGTSFAAINDLDLEVEGPGGVVYKGNFFASGQSAPDGTRDDRNNVEQVHLSVPAAGEYTVRVKGTGVNQSRQGYALVVTGDILTRAAGVSVELLSAVPSTIAPGASLGMELVVESGEDELVAGSMAMHYQHVDGEYTAVPLTLVEGSNYRVELPASFCGESPRFYFSVEGVKSGVQMLPAAGALSPYRIAVGSASVAFSDDMEQERGWTVGAPTDTATRGIWVRATPNQGVGVPPGDHSEPGTFCYITGQEGVFGGGSRNDVDHGATTLISPAIDLAGRQTAVVSYERWFDNNGGAAPQTDMFIVEASGDGGATWSLVEQVGPKGVESRGEWIRHQAPLQGLVGLTADVRIRFVARDDGKDSNIEAGIDDFRVDAVSCDGPMRCGCDWNGDGKLDSRDFFDFVTEFFGGGADFNRNGASDSQDLFDFLGCFFGGCG